MADENPGWFRRFRFWICHYHLELGFGWAVVAVSWKILGIMDAAPDDAFTAYQRIIMVCTVLIMLVAAVVMSNTARTRVSTAQILDEVRGGDAEKR